MNKIATLLALFTLASQNALAADKAAATKPLKKETSKELIDADTKIVLKAVASHYEKLGNWEAAFVQETFSTGLGTSSANEGRLTFLVPNKFRFSILSPEKSDFISNGKNAWYIQYPKGKQKGAYVRHFTDLSKIELDRYLVLLRGFKSAELKDEKKLSSNFLLKGSTKGESFSLEIQPKNAAEITKITMEFKRGVLHPQTAILEDAVGNTTTIRIHSVQNIADPEAENIQLRLRPDHPKDAKVERF